MASKWKPIYTAPRKSFVSGTNQYGPWIIAYPVFGEVGMCRWWQTTEGTEADLRRFRNFIEPGGNAVHPTHWMQTPRAPT
jgi:hypothetical protein